MVWLLGLSAGLTGEAAAGGATTTCTMCCPLLPVAFSYSYTEGVREADEDGGGHSPSLCIPTLAAMLAEWKLGGWAEMMGPPAGSRMT